MRPIATQGSTNRRLLALQRALLDMPVPVVGRIHDGSLLLDLRCLDEESLLIAQLVAAAQR